MAGLFDQLYYSDLNNNNINQQFNPVVSLLLKARLNPNGLDDDFGSALSLLHATNLAQLALGAVKSTPIIAFSQALANTLDDDLNTEDDDIASFISVPYHQFDFAKVKSRSYRQLLSTSGTPVQMNKVFRLYQTFFHDYKVEYRDFMFDIYEDGRYGLNIAIPSGNQLIVDKNNFLLVQGEMFCRTCPYEIQYHARELLGEEQAVVAKTPQTFLNTVADKHWVDLNEEGDFGEYGDFRDIESFGSNRYVLRAAYNDFEQPFKSQFELNYLTAAANRDAWFQAQGILNRFDRKFFAALDKHRGTDCRRVSGDPVLAPLCKDITTMLKVLISVHLTTFSNKFYAGEPRMPALTSSQP